MNLPDLRYGCVHCGLGCQQFEVELSEAEFGHIERLETGYVERRGDRRWLRRECGQCHFLLEDAEHRCGLHRRHGAEAKPRPCREFPFRARVTPGGVFVGASFACTAIQEGHGPPVSEATVREHLGEVTPTELVMPPLAPGLPFDWDEYTRWEAETLTYLRALGGVGLWRAALERSSALLGGGRLPGPGLEAELGKVFRGLLTLAEGPLEPEEALVALEALATQGRYRSQLLGRELDVAEVMARWEEPWPAWPAVQPFFEHLLFRKYLLEGPTVHARLCSLPILAQILQFLTIARGEEENAGWAIRMVESRLTFHARGLDGYLGRCGEAFLQHMEGPA